VRDFVDCLVWFLDCADHRGVSKSRIWIHHLREKFKPHLLLIFANKQDLPSALGANSVSEILGLRGLNGQKWSVQAVCGKEHRTNIISVVLNSLLAISGDGLTEGMEWIQKVWSAHLQTQKRI